MYTYWLIQVIFDAEAKTMECVVNGDRQGIAFWGVDAAPVFPSVSVTGTGASVHLLGCWSGIML